MIGRIHNKELYNFAEQLETVLEQKVGHVMETCEPFFKQHFQIHGFVKKNFDVYLEATNPFNYLNNQHRVIIELDYRSLLDLTGNYNPKENKLEDLRFRGILPYHHSWNSEHFSDISFSQDEQNELLEKQEAFREELEKLNIGLLIDIAEFNPGQDTLPEAVVEFHPKKRSFDAFTKDSSFVSLLTLYYKYCQETIEMFEKKDRNLSKEA